MVLWGDGVNLGSEALQRAIDTGDKVLFPAGTYRCGTLRSHSNLTLIFEEGCRIAGSEKSMNFFISIPPGYLPEVAVL